MSPDLHALLAEYRAGLDAELSLLRQLDALSTRQRLAATASDSGALRDVHTARDSVMRSLVEVEHEIVPLRAALAEARHQLAGDPEFQAVAALHKEAAAMVTRIIASDEEAKRALEQAELARRSAASAMEKGETTLQAYRRVITPTANASLLNRRG
jgi:ATPase subunit of ABC transporter with duplicated ATPase domains